MKLDIKARLRNKYFWVSMLSLVVLLLDQLGIKLPIDINAIGGTILNWEQPNSTNPYMKGDKVIHNGKTYVCTIDNNVWEPGVYGWEEITEQRGE